MEIDELQKRNMQSGKMSWRSRKQKADGAWIFGPADGGNCLSAEFIGRENGNRGTVGYGRIDEGAGGWADWEDRCIWGWQGGK